MSPIDPSRYAYPDVGRPWVRANFVATIDGAAYDSHGVTDSLGGEADKQVFAMLRSLADVIVVGAGTARAEGYGPAATPIAVVSHSLNLPPKLHQPGIIVVTTTEAPAKRVQRLQSSGADVVMCGTGTIDWREVLAELDSRGWPKVLCEGGPTVFGELIQADLVDELCLTTAPLLAAGDARRIAHSVLPLSQDMRLAFAEAVGDVLFTRWVRRHDE
ncbi:MAG TPA: dihydrofolate reductase family protein [Aeromicrobium sp.]|nr:dihydrofolate reductase family protein [Aeromicrobium sp.]